MGVVDPDHFRIGMIQKEFGSEGNQDNWLHFFKNSLVHSLIRLNGKSFVCMLRKDFFFQV